MDNISTVAAVLLVLFGMWVGLYMPSLVDKGITSGRLDPGMRDRKRFFRIVGYISMLCGVALAIARLMR